MKQNDSSPKQVFEQIEHKKRTWKSKFWREQSIWDEISLQLNSSLAAGDNKEIQFWEDVMDLYHHKYR